MDVQIADLCKIEIVDCIGGQADSRRCQRGWKRGRGLELTLARRVNTVARGAVTLRNHLDFLIGTTRKSALNHVHVTPATLRNLPGFV